MTYSIDRRWRVAVGLGLAFLAPNLVQAQEPPAAGAPAVQYIAWLGGANVAPPTTTQAAGEAEFNFNTETLELTWSVEYENLTGTPTDIAIHGPAGAGEVAPKVIDLGAVSASPLTGSATLTDAQAEDLADGSWYVSIATAAFPGGEIQGPVVPEVIEAGVPRPD